MGSGERTNLIVSKERKRDKEPMKILVRNQIILFKKRIKFLGITLDNESREGIKQYQISNSQKMWKR